MTKEKIYTELEALNESLEQKLLSHINSLAPMTTLSITAVIDRKLEVRRSWKSWKKNLYDVVLSICPQVDKPFGTELELEISADDFQLNYGTCGQQSLFNDPGFIQKNLMIGTLASKAQELQEFIFSQSETSEAISLLEALNAIQEAEWEEKQKAAQEKKAAEEAQKKLEEAQKLADKKAKAAARRKARREAKKAQTEAQN